MGGLARIEGRPTSGSVGTVVELFAGVGGLRLGLEVAGWRTTWANQWEPSTKSQHAFDCYVRRFFTERGIEVSADESLHELRAGSGDIVVNEDIATVLNQIAGGARDAIPDHDLLVGGFPCQDYSVAKVLSQARGIEGKKGVLWWSIHRILEEKRPRLVLLENVDRLLKSPAVQRGRDFAIILASLSDLGYLVEWRVVNAADYGFPQRRRRVFVAAHHRGETQPTWRGPLQWLFDDGALARALPVIAVDDEVASIGEGDSQPSFPLPGDLTQITNRFGWGNPVTPFRAGGVMWDRDVWTRDLKAAYRGPTRVLGDVLERIDAVPPEYFIPDDKLPAWRYLKGAKREERTAANGHTYFYSEGAVTFPDALHVPSRTILTGEGGSGPSRFKHVVRTQDGRYRRLTPVELERLNGFPSGWTEGMSDGRRAFTMGNALVVGVVEGIGRALAELDPAGRLAVSLDAVPAYT